MVKEINRTSQDDREKILVCITAQSNSKRLIDKGAQVADKRNGELHILNVQKGNNIFHNEDTPRLLEELFNYGTEKGAMVHAYCDDNIPESIALFIQKEKITRLVLGQPPKDLQKNLPCNVNQFHRIIERMPQKIEVVIVGKEDEQYIVEQEKTAVSL